MSEENQPQPANQNLISHYFQVNPENSQNRLNQKKRKVQESDTQKKKQMIRTKTDSDESNDQAPQQPQSSVNCYTLDKYIKTAQGKPIEIKKPVIQKVEVKQENEAAKLSQKIVQMEAVEKQLRMENKQLEVEKIQISERHSIFKRRIQEMFKDALKQNEELKRDMLRDFLENEKSRLGGVKQRRDSVRFVDELYDGFEIKQVKKQLMKLEQEIGEIRKQKGELKNKSQSFARKNTNDKQTKLLFSMEDNSNSQADLDLQSRKKRFSLQLTTLEKEEADLKLYLQRLEDQRQQLEYKILRFADEQQCRYIKSEPPWPCIADRYQILGLLGKGGFSEVYKSFDLEEFRYCACKIHQLVSHWSESSKQNYIKHALRENAIQQRLKHHNIVQVYDTQEIDQDSFCTILEYCEGCDLSQYLKKYKTLSEKEAKLIIRQVLAALHYMSHQSPKIIHYDLKPSNIIFHKGEIKISDFGLCKLLDHDSTRVELTSQGLGTYWYLPPECFGEGSQSTISTKVDVWSVGVIFFEMLYGKKPFGHGMSQERIIKEQVMLKAYSVPFPQKTSISQDCRDFITKCLTYNMEARWDISEAYYGTYINKN